ncbi:hypothetical protein PVAG01_06812 [Phlyctema vagabunda]|uniref:Uncharacterized protein n=1 Tax=Phlyctema vagabunda TaxID=108571 RepID=A0ABR4PH51_9HELO
MTPLPALDEIWQPMRTGSSGYIGAAPKSRGLAERVAEEEGELVTSIRFVAGGGSPGQASESSEHDTWMHITPSGIDVFVGWLSFMPDSSHTSAP